MGDDRVDAIVGRVGAATPGPWRAYRPKGERPNVQQHKDGVGVNVVAFIDGQHWDRALEDANAEFIAHAREDVPYLLGRIRDLETERAEERSALWTAQSRAANAEGALTAARAAAMAHYNSKLDSFKQRGRDEVIKDVLAALGVGDTEPNPR
jgi:hypothetical protein